MNDPINYVDPSGLTAEDITKMQNAFNDYVDHNPNRLPGRNPISSTLNNSVAFWGEYLFQPLGWNVNPLKGCAAQAADVLDTLSNLKQKGVLSNDFEIVPTQTGIPNVMEHNFLTATSKADNVQITIDPWKGVFEIHPLNH